MYWRNLRSWRRVSILPSSILLDSDACAKARQRRPGLHVSRLNLYLMVLRILVQYLYYAATLHWFPRRITCRRRWDSWNKLIPNHVGPNFSREFWRDHFVVIVICSEVSNVFYLMFDQWRFILFRRPGLAEGLLMFDFVLATRENDALWVACLVTLLDQVSQTSELHKMTGVENKYHPCRVSLCKALNLLRHST